MKKTMLSIILFCLFLPISSSADTSFNCKKATTDIEKIVCHNDTLGAYDIVLAKQYQSIRTWLSPHAKKELKQQQLTWLKARQSHCTDAASCTKFYAQRLMALNKMYTNIRKNADIKMYQVTTPKVLTRLTQFDLGNYLAHITWIDDSTHQVILIKKDGNQIIQTIELKGDSDNLDYQQVTTTKDPFLDMFDYDQDGYKDLRLRVGRGSGGNSYEIWRYNTEKGLFEHYGSDIQGYFQGI